MHGGYLRPKFREPTAVKPVAACPVPVCGAGPVVAAAAGALAALTDDAATGPVLGAAAGAITGAAAALLLPAANKQSNEGYDMCVLPAASAHSAVRRSCAREHSCGRYWQQVQPR